MILSPKDSGSMKRSWKIAPLILTATALCGQAVHAAPYEVAAYYFPNYHADPRNEARYGGGWNEWTLMRAAAPRFPGHEQPKVPAWGYEDESQPEVMAKKIAAAADHGVTAWIFDWYWYDNKPFLEKCLNEGFLKAANRQRLKFALMWANHTWLDIFPAKAGVPSKTLYAGPVSREVFDHLTDHVVHDYFSQPNYWKIDGKPYFSLYETKTFIDGLGGLAQAREALRQFRGKVRKAGLPGLHLNAVGWGDQVTPEWIKALGIDSVTSYCWCHHLAMADCPTTAYSAFAEHSAKVWRELKKRWLVPYYPNVSMGWDSSPRTTQSDPLKNQGYPYTNVLVGNTPAEFQKALQRAKAFLDADPQGPRIITINAWNEWTEGSYLEPDTVHGLGYLDAIRAVFQPQ
jgi:hypothetical protein